jgi:hypothetical protein
MKLDPPGSVVPTASEADRFAERNLSEVIRDLGILYILQCLD